MSRWNQVGNTADTYINRAWCIIERFSWSLSEFLWRLLRNPRLALIFLVFLFCKTRKRARTLVVVFKFIDYKILSLFFLNPTMINFLKTYYCPVVSPCTECVAKSQANLLILFRSSLAPLSLSNYHSQLYFLRLFPFRDSRKKLFHNNYLSQANFLAGEFSSINNWEWQLKVSQAVVARAPNLTAEEITSD